MIKFHITIATVTLLLCTCWDCALCSRMHVFNFPLEDKGNIYVTCSGNKAYEVSMVIPPKFADHVIPLPPHGSKVWPPVTCIGKTSEVASKEYILYLSTSNDRLKRCKKSCTYAVITDNIFRRYDMENKTWVPIPPRIWYP